MTMKYQTEAGIIEASSMSDLAEKVKEIRKVICHLVYDRKLSSGYEVPDGAMIIITTDPLADQTGAVALAEE